MEIFFLLLLGLGVIFAGVSGSIMEIIKEEFLEKEVRGGREGKVLRRKERTIKPRERERKRNQKSEHRNIGLQRFKKTKSKTPFQLHFLRK